MKVAVFGSTGQTGFQVVKQLLDENIYVKAVARNDEKFLNIKNADKLDIIIGNIPEMDRSSIKSLLYDVDAVVSCLGHNLSIKGVFGKPHYLVFNSILKILDNLNNEKKQKVILMNTTACKNDVLLEKYTVGEKIVMNIFHNLLPPQRDNEKALKLLMDHDDINWVAVRPDTLIDEEKVTEYKIFETVQRSPVFNAGKTSRINVANFIKELIVNEDLWTKWRHKTPVIYNVE